MIVFNCLTFEEYFNFIINEHKNDRGYKTKLAQAAFVNPSYITKICKGLASITIDQAVSLAEFWQLSYIEKEYFLWLVIKGRAGNSKIKKMAEDKLLMIKKENEDLGNRITAEKINPIIENQYYMNWIYPAIHMLCTLKEPLTVSDIAIRLGLSKKITNSAVDILIQIGFIQKNLDGNLIASKKNIHLSNQNWMAPLQHKNWRIYSTDRIGNKDLNDIRYTGIHSISINDLQKLKQKVQDFLIDTDRLIRPSNEETVCILCLDLFEI